MPQLSDDQLAELAQRLAEPLAERVADVAFRKFSEQVGRSIIKHLLWLLGIGVVGLHMFWQSKTGGAP